MAALSAMVIPKRWEPGVTEPWSSDRLSLSLSPLAGGESGLELFRRVDCCWLDTKTRPEDKRKKALLGCVALGDDGLFISAQSLAKPARSSSKLSWVLTIPWE